MINNKIVLYFTDVLLPELIVCMILLQLEVPLLLHQVNWVQLLVPLLDTLDKFNRLASGVDKEDVEDLSWPGIIGSYIPCVFNIQMSQVSGIKIRC